MNIVKYIFPNPSIKRDWPKVGFMSYSDNSGLGIVSRLAPNIKR